MPQGIKTPRSALVDDPWMGPMDAARLLGMSRFRFMTFAMAHGIETQRVAGRTVVSREQVERLARELRKSA